MGYDQGDFLSRLKAANEYDGTEVFPQATPMGSSAEYTAPMRSPIRPTPSLYRRTEVSPSRGWGYWLLLGAVALLAYGVGSWTHSTAIPDHGPVQAAGETPGEVVTVTVTSEVTKTVAQLPKECSDTLQLAAELAASLDPVIDAGDKTQDLLKKARIAIVEQNHQALNNIGTQVNDLGNKTSRATATVLDLQHRFAVSLAACNKAIGR